MAQTLSYNDCILFVSLLYSCADVLCEWAAFDTCSRPIHQWLLVSYGCVVSFRLTHVLGGMKSASATEGSGAAGLAAGDFLLNLRHKDAMPRMLASFTWAVALPFFTMWTLLGTLWLYKVTTQTPQCVPTATHLWFSAFWLGLCYVWIIIHLALGGIAWVLERRVRRAEGDLRAIEDDDVIARWGQVSNLAGYQSLTGSLDKGLTPSQIQSLPWEIAGDFSQVELGEGPCECPICINDLKPGDSIRRLPGCRHAFHRSCIDLWLLRNGDCPLCKSNVAKALNSFVD